MITGREPIRRIIAVIELELFTEAHIPGVEALVADPDALRFTRIPEPVPADFAGAWFARYEEARRDGSREAFAVVEDGEFLGLALAVTLDPETQTAELGYIVMPSARGRGVATEALRQLTEWTFAKGMLRIELLISVDNPASKKVAERCDYVREGVLRNAYLKPGRREDTEIWSRLVTD
jgi:RimJ/RimL family protein N-acetyltransferase